METKTETYLKRLIPIIRYKREKISVGFSKSGVDQTWELYFNKGRLLTDKIHTNYQEPIYLRQVEKLKTLKQVLLFLHTYSYNEASVKIISQLNLLDNGYLYRLNEILNFNLDIKKVKGIVYFGSYTISFDNGNVSFLYRGIHDYGTYKITGKFDLLKTVNNILNRVQSNIEFLHRVKKLENL